MGVTKFNKREVLCHDCGRCIADDNSSDVWYRIGQYGDWYCGLCYECKSLAEYINSFEATK